MQKHAFSDKYVQEETFLNALAEAFRMQEAILNATEFAIFSFTPDGIIRSFNRAAEVLLGYNAEELIGKESPLLFHDIDEVIHKAEKLSISLGRSLEPAYEVLIAKGNSNATTAEWTMIRKDGFKFPVSLTTTTLYDDQENLIGYAGIVKDITKDKEREEQIIASEQKFKLLAENIPGVIYLCHNDANYSMIYLNDRIEELTGYPAKDFISGERTIVELFHKDDKDEVFRIINNALEQRKSYHLMYRLWHKSGEWRWIDEVGAGVYINDKLSMLEGFLSDITYQKLAEEKLEHIAEENLRVFNNPVTLNAVVGFDGYFKRVSPTWSNVLGWPAEELMRHSMLEFVHPEDREPTRAVAQHIIEGNNIPTFENRYKCKDGSYRWLLWGLACDTNHNLIYTSTLDITERKKSEEQLLNSKKSLESLAVQLQEQNRQLDQFAHIISHNLRSPLSNINALINLLDENSSVQDYRLIFEKLRNVSNNLGGTMNDLMETLKAKNVSNIEIAEVKFKDMLNKVIQSLEGDLIHAEASVTYDFNLAPSLAYSKAYMESIFQNLLSNAIKYRSPARKADIHFETFVVGDTIELHVSDNGLGIDMEKYGHKMFSLHSTFHEHEHARGVGLFLVKTQIEAMGGFIDVQSTVGVGTKFIIRFKKNLEKSLSEAR